MLCEVDELNKAFKVKFGNTVRLEIHSPCDVFPEVRWYGDGNCPYTILPGAWYLSFVVLIFVSAGMQANISIVEIMLAPYSRPVAVGKMAEVCTFSEL